MSPLSKIKIGKCSDALAFADFCFGMKCGKGKKNTAEQGTRRERVLCIDRLHLILKGRGGKENKNWIPVL